MKKLSIIVIILFLAACSAETIPDEGIKPDIDTPEVTVKTVQQLEETEEEEYIKISKADAPQLWSTPDVQLWKYVVDTSLYEEIGWKQEITSWRKFNDEFDKSLSPPNETWQSPGNLLVAFMADVEISNWLGRDIWEVNSRIEMLDEHNAHGYIMSYGFYDDSVAGRDIRLTMKKENGFWYIVDAEERDHCYRGLGKDGDLCL
ncbi:hypothetical protein [Sporosarcina sp. UB5]|uniref:hypothetical protein n=1 Tax=Sporosarcina sp. UB5 TaxID=3047463 RepID=UPI003D7B2D0B